MEGENCKRVPSVPTNFLTLAQLQERWLREKQKEKEEEEKEARRQKEDEEEQEERNRKEKEEQQQKIRIQQSLKRQNEYGVRPRSNNLPRPPFHRNRPNQCAGGRGDEQKPANTHVAEVFSVETDDYVRRRTGWKRGEPINRSRQNQCPNGKLEPEETHIGESVAGVGEPKIDGSLKRRTGSEKGKPFHRSLQNQSPVGGDSGNTELKLGKTHVAEVTPEDAGRKIDDSIKKTGSEKRRGNPRSEKANRTGVLLPKRGADKEITAGGEKKAWVGELERKIEKISLCDDGGGEVLNMRHSGYVHGGGHHRKYNKVPGGIDWRKRNSNLVWVKKEG